MWEFIQAYGIWFVMGALFLMAMRGHGVGGHGVGCCGMGHQHGGAQTPADTESSTRTSDDSSTTTRRGHAGGCH
jgi:hypothetical protein